MSAGEPPLPRRRVVHRGDVDLVVHEGGNPDGPVLVMVHGWPDTHRLWDGVAERLGDDFRLAAYDTRGQGGRSPTRPTRPSPSTSSPMTCSPSSTP